MMFTVEAPPKELLTIVDPIVWSNLSRAQQVEKLAYFTLRDWLRSQMHELRRIEMKVSTLQDDDAWFAAIEVGDDEELRACMNNGSSTIGKATSHLADAMQHCDAMLSPGSPKVDHQQRTDLPDPFIDAWRAILNAESSQ